MPTRNTANCRCCNAFNACCVECEAFPDEMEITVAGVAAAVGQPNGPCCLLLNGTFTAGDRAGAPCTSTGGGSISWNQPPTPDLVTCGTVTNHQRFWGVGANCNSQCGVPFPQVNTIWTASVTIAAVATISSFWCHPTGSCEGGAPSASTTFPAACNMAGATIGYAPA